MAKIRWWKQDQVLKFDKVEQRWRRSWVHCHQSSWYAFYWSSSPSPYLGALHTRICCWRIRLERIWPLHGPPWIHVDLFTVLYQQRKSTFLGNLCFNVAARSICISSLLFDAAPRYCESVPFIVKCDQISDEKQQPTPDGSLARAYPGLHICRLAFYILLWPLPKWRYPVQWIRKRRQSL